MDEEASRLEREEKRRLRRERIKRILEDDSSSTPTRRTRDTNGVDTTSRGERSSSATRRTRAGSGSTSSLRTRSKSRDELDYSTEKSSRSRHTIEESSITDSDRSSSPTGWKARREARRKRNQEHVSLQNKLTLENGDVSHHPVTTRSRSGDRAERVNRYRRDRSEEALRQDGKESVSKRTSSETEGRETERSEKVEAEKMNGEDLLKPGDVSAKDEQFKNGEEDLDKNAAKDKLDIPHAVETQISAENGDISECAKENEVGVEKRSEDVKKVDGMEEVTGEITEITETDIEGGPTTEKKCDIFVEKSEQEKLMNEKDSTKLDSDKKQGVVLENETTKPKDTTTVIEEPTEFGNVTDTDGKSRESLKDDLLKDSKDAKDVLDGPQDINKDRSKAPRGTVTRKERHDSAGKTGKQSPGNDKLVGETENEVRNDRVNKNITKDVKISKSTVKEVSDKQLETVAKKETPKETMRREDTQKGVGPSKEADKESAQVENKQVEAIMDKEPPEENLRTKEKQAEVIVKTETSNETLKTDEKRTRVAEKKTPMEFAKENKQIEIPAESETQRKIAEVVEKQTDVAVNEEVRKEPKRTEGREMEVTEKKEHPSEIAKTKERKTEVTTKKETAKTQAKQTEITAKKETSSPRKGKLKVDGDSWQKSTRKKKGVVDRDRAVELHVLGKTGKLKSKLKSCEKRDVESADAWKKEVKAGPVKQKSLDEETQKELHELTRKRELKERVQACNEMDNESAEFWKREVKKDARKHRSLDIDAEQELNELAKASALKDRIKECEQKDQESADAWKKQIKKGELPEVAEVLEDSEEMKEFAESKRLKDLIASCSERDMKKDESWKSAKEKCKAMTAEEEAELRQLNLSAAKSEIISTFEEREKESAEAALRRVKPGEGPKTLEELNNEELKELAKTVDVKGRIKLKVEEEGRQPEVIPKGVDLAEEEELKEINLKGRIEAYKEESKKLGTEGTTSDKTGKGFIPIKDETSSDTSSSLKKESVTTRDTRGLHSPSKDSGRISPTKISSGDKTSPRKKDLCGTTSPTKKDPSASPSKGIGHRGKTSPTKGETSGKEFPTKDGVHSDKTLTKVGVGGRTSPAKEPIGHGRISPIKKDAVGKTLPAKGAATSKSKLESIRANLYDGGKGKIKSKRESLDRVSKKVSIKDKIAACKQRDKLAPVRKLPVEKTPAKPRPKTTVDQTADAPDLIPVNRVSDQVTSTDDDVNDEVVDVDIKGKMSYWESPRTDSDDATCDESAQSETERPTLVNLGTEKQSWVSKNRKLSAAEFIKALLNAKCRRRELKDIHDVKSDTKKYLVLKKGEENVKGSSVGSEREGEKEPGGVKKSLEKALEKNVEKLNEKNLEKSTTEPVSENLDDFSFDDVINPNEVKQLSGFSDFRRQVRPAKRRAAKSNPLRKLQQRKDVKTEADLFDEIIDDEEEEEVLKPTAIGGLGKPIEPGHRKPKGNTFSKDALAGLSAKEDVSKINLKKTAKSRKGVSQEKSQHDGTAPVMLMQIKGHRHLQTRLVKPSAESLNSGDSFLCMADKHLYIWHGKDSNVMKKSKASEIANRILQYKLLNCNATAVTIIKDDRVNIGTGLRKHFWDLLGDKAAIKSTNSVPKDGDYEKGVVSTNGIFVVDSSCEPAKLEKLPELCGKIPSIKMLDSDKAYVFDFGTEVYSWLGRTCDKSARSNGVTLGLEVFKGKFHTESSLNPITPNNPSDGKGTPVELERPSWAIFGRMTERAETILFEEKFLDWPDPKMKVKLDQQKDLLNKNLSGGYAKRKAKLEPVEVEIIELVAYDGAKMAEKPLPIEMILEGVNVGRGRGSYDEIERRSLTVTTNSVTVYHSSEKEYRQLEEKEWGHFYSAESYVIRWSYCVKASGIRSLKGGESKHDSQATGRDQIAYFFWHGRDCSASGKGTSALATIELDSDKSPQIMVDQGDESACFLNMFDGQMTVHHGKLNDKTAIEEDNVLMYCVQHEDERETSFIQIEARSSNLRSRSSFVIVIVGKSVGVCVWHGSKSTKEKKEGALRGAKRLAVWFQGLFNVAKSDIVELDEGQEENMFWEVLDGKSNYGSLLQLDRKCDNQVRLFYFTSAEGPFLAKEILDRTRGELLSPYPFLQSELYSASQPAIFLVDAVHSMYLWQGWWPSSPDESDSANTTGSAEFRWHRDRRLAMQTTQSYADIVGRQMAKSYVVNSGLEPVEFRAMFPFWEDHPDVTLANLESGKVNGEKASMIDILAKLSRDRYTLAELQVRPLPEGVDPSKMEMYLSDEEFKDVFKVTKEEFTKLPKWKKLEQRKNAGLF